MKFSKQAFGRAYDAYGFRRPNEFDGLGEAWRKYRATSASNAARFSTGFGGALLEGARTLPLAGGAVIESVLPTKKKYLGRLAESAGRQTRGALMDSISAGGLRDLDEVGYRNGT